MAAYIHIDRHSPILIWYVLVLFVRTATFYDIDIGAVAIAVMLLAEHWPLAPRLIGQKNRRRLAVNLSIGCMCMVHSAVNECALLRQYTPARQSYDLFFCIFSCMHSHTKYTSIAEKTDWCHFWSFFVIYQRLDCKCTTLCIRRSTDERATIKCSNHYQLVSLCNASNIWLMALPPRMSIVSLPASHHPSQMNSDKQQKIADKSIIMKSNLNCNRTDGIVKQISDRMRKSLSAGLFFLLLSACVSLPQPYVDSISICKYYGSTARCRRASHRHPNKCSNE